MRAKQYPPVRHYVYINPNGSHYLPPDAELFQPLEELPEGVEQFWFDLRVQSAGENKAMLLELQRRLQVVKIGHLSDTERGIRSAEINREVERAHLAGLIADWDLEDANGNKIPPSLEAFDALEPVWLQTLILQAHVDLNLSKN